MVKPFLLFAVLVAACGNAPPASAAERPLNVLFIVADDLRPDLGCYGVAGVHSPNIDRLAARGTVFERAYCQVALCNPSRTSFLTGLRPDTTKIYGNGGHFRDIAADAVTLPQYFKRHGYEVRGLGKIFHPGCDDAPSWSVPAWQPSKPRYGPAGQAVAAARTEQVRRAGKTPRTKDTLGPPWEAADAADDDLTDGDTAAAAVRTLGELKDGPFFLAVGFLMPHLPFVAPKKYWELYPPEQTKLAANSFLPRDLPGCALHDWSELRAFMGMPATGPLDEMQAREAIRGYRAATSFLDAQVGRVLDELDRLGLADDTVVVFLGDHGWQLGEHAHWCKHTNFDVALRTPLVVAAPRSAGAGTKTAGLVELVDLYPTLAELCGLPPPANVDGLSFAQLVADASRAWKRAAFSQYERKVPGLGVAMGRSVVNERYRYTEWRVPGVDFLERELYDHQTDAAENVNVAARAEYAEAAQTMSRLLHGPKNALIPAAVK